MKVKVWCFLISDKIKIKSGKWDIEKSLIDCRPSLFEKICIAVPKGVEGVPFKKNRVAFLVDAKHLLCVRFGGVDVSCEEIKEIATKLELYSRNKFWRFLGGRAMDIVELLITMCAGYGVLRWLEYFIQSIMAK